MRARLSWTLLAALSGLILPCSAGLAQAQQASAVDAKIEIVWPHDPQGNYQPTVSLLVNVEVYLFQRGTLNPVACDFPNQVTLYRARNLSSPGRFSGGQEAARDTSVTAQRVTRTVDGKSFPVWVFNNVPTGREEYQLSFLTNYFFVDVAGADTRTNVWAHSGDPRTYYPGQVTPEQTVGPPSAVDASIQIVWPHDPQGHQQPVATAPLANAGVDLFAYPFTSDHRQSVGFDFNHPVRILQALNNGFLAPVKAADDVVTMHGSNFSGGTVSWPRWEFNDLDVSVAQDPANKHYFAVAVDGVPTHTTIWAHGADARTYFPQRDVPAASGVGCS